MSRDYIFILSRDFMHFGSCYFKLINEQKKELYKNVLCHRFSTFITVCKTHKTEICHVQRANQLRPFNQFEDHPHIAHLTNLNDYDFFPDVFIHRLQHYLPRQ